MLMKAVDEGLHRSYSWETDADFEPSGRRSVQNFADRLPNHEIESIKACDSKLILPAVLVAIAISPRFPKRRCGTGTLSSRRAFS